MALTPEDEEIASQYRDMLIKGLPEGAVIQKMAIYAIPQHIQNAVLTGEDTNSDVGGEEENSGSDPPSSNLPSADDASQDEEMKFEAIERPSVDPNDKSSTSFWEEEVFDDDDSIEEEVVDDDEEEVLVDDGDFEEEFLEEVVDDSEYFNQKDAGDSEYENQKEDSEGDSDGSASTGIIPETESNASSNSTTNSHSNVDDRSTSEGNVYDRATSGGDVYDKSTSGRDVENQQQVQAYRPQSNTSLVRRTPEKPLPSPSSFWYWVLCLILLGLIGAGAGVGYWLSTRNGDDVQILNSSSRTSPPTMAPSVSVSTEFDAVQGECNFDGVLNPNPIDQCLCFGEITAIETDIRDRYLYNLEYFIPDYFEDYNDDISSCSARNQALVWISSGDDAQLTRTQRSQKFALATIYASLGGSQWTNNTNWLANEDVCTWFGVSCAQDYVTELVLDENNLLGMLPSELSLLERLQFLMVARNKISGPMPVSLFSIQALGTVDVGFNSITGVIPPAVGNAVSLNSLNVENNYMSGRLTKSIGKAINLGHLNLRSNQFASELPMELFDLQRMRHLDIGDNAFSGIIPDGISKLNALEVLTLGPNLFTGTIPSTLSSVNQLRYLSVRGIVGLSGRIPAEFGFQLNRLEEIIISGTSVSGNIDTSFGRLPSLKSLDFSNNQLRSVIPSELGNLANLVTLDLGYNFLDGQIPDSIGNIATLQQIRLNNNLLQGGIPISFGNLSSLETMRLEANRLEDRVADEVCNLREDILNVFVVDCPIEIRGNSGIETFGVVCKVPECCTNCVVQ